MVITKMVKTIKLNTGNGSKVLPDVSIRVSLYPISPIIITVLVIRATPTFEKVSCERGMQTKRWFINRSLSLNCWLVLDLCGINDCFIIISSRSSLKKWPQQYPAVATTDNKLIIINRYKFVKFSSLRRWTVWTNFIYLLWKDNVEHTGVPQKEQEYDRKNTCERLQNLEKHGNIKP